jgi:DNA-binding MarR family transcriptional regulator
MRTPELKARRLASAAVAEMTLDNFLALLDGYEDEEAIMRPEYFVAMVILEAEEILKLPPINKTDIAKRLRTSRQNVSNWIPPLIKRGVIEEVRGGYVVRDEFFIKRHRAPYHKRMIDAIRRCFRKLEGYEP